MAQTKILAISGRNVKVEVTWENGWKRTFDIPNCPTPDGFAACLPVVTAYIEGMYAGVAAEELAKEEAARQPAADCLAAVGHTFAEDGSLIS